MTLDALDQAFLDRWRSRTAPTDHVCAEPAHHAKGDAVDQAPTAELPPAEPLPHAAPAASAPPPAAIPVAIPPTPAVLPPLSPLAHRLLAAAPAQWHALADEIEAARLAGHRVIAITGGESGEGRSTLVLCLASVLVQRGRDVTICDATDLAACVDGVVGGGQLHDKRIVLVDAGIWFPPGPVRRSRLVVASLGCDAAILVRRADRGPAPARATALAAVGVEPLGEVVTFAPNHAPVEEAAA